MLESLRLLEMRLRASGRRTVRLSPPVTRPQRRKQPPRARKTAPRIPEVRFVIRELRFEAGDANREVPRRNFVERTHDCGVCSGSGVRKLQRKRGDHRSWRFCTHCEGAGRIETTAKLPDEVTRRWAIVLHADTEASGLRLVFDHPSTALAALSAVRELPEDYAQFLWSKAPTDRAA